MGFKTYISLKTWIYLRPLAAALFLFIIGAVTPASGKADATFIDRDDGTYKTVIVNSIEACKAICRAEEKVCRGTISIQADVTKPEIQCRLNNGFGANPAFPRVPPEPLYIDIALADLNNYRALNGLPAVRLNPQLNSVSQNHANDRAAAGTIAHEGTDGLGHGDRLKNAGYLFSIAAENVASGQKSWEQVFKAWQDSPGHNVNLLRKDVTEFGVAMTYAPKTSQSVYWVMLVAAPLS